MVLPLSSLSDHAININLNLLVYHVMKECNHCTLIRHLDFFQIERHDPVMKNLPRSYECHLHIVILHLNLVIPGESIHEGE